MTEKELAVPTALGLGSFALTTFILSVVNAELIPKESLGMVLPMGLFYGGMAQFCAGMWEMKRGDTFGATAFSSSGAFWLGLSTMIIFEYIGIIPEVPKTGLAVFLVAWGIFCTYMTIGSFRIAKGISVIFVILTPLFFLLAIGEFNHFVKIIGGYGGILCALCAWYCSAAILLESSYGREILPLGKVKNN